MFVIFKIFKLLIEMKTFERGRSVKVTLGLGKRVLIKKWFDDLGISSNAYVINDDFSIDYNSWLNLENTNITKLPNNLTVNGWLDLRNTNITELPDNLTIHHSLFLDNTKITKLPDNLKVKGNILITIDMKLSYVPKYLKNKIKII